MVGGRDASDASGYIQVTPICVYSVKFEPTTDYRLPTTMTITGLGVSEEAGTRAPTTDYRLLTN